MADLVGVRRAAAAGAVVAGVVVSTLCVLLVLLRGGILRLFSTDPAVLALTSPLLPVVALAIVADGLQAVFGFGLTGLKRAGSSFVIFCVLYGTLAIVAIPVSQTFGMLGLWGALAAINLCLVAGQAVAFRRATTRAAIAA